jgi:hypothetical protein
MPSTPQQIRRRDQIESALRLATPFLDFLLVTGERVSRIVAPAEDSSYAIRPAGERLELGELRPLSKSKPPRPAED